VDQLLTAAFPSTTVKSKQLTAAFLSTTVKSKQLTAAFPSTTVQDQQLTAAIPSSKAVINSWQQLVLLTLTTLTKLAPLHSHQQRVKIRPLVRQGPDFSSFNHFWKSVFFLPEHAWDFNHELQLSALLRVILGPTGGKYPFFLQDGDILNELNTFFHLQITIKNDLICPE
jgi:hypothetical protein